MIKLMQEDANIDKLDKLDKTIKHWAKTIVRDYDDISSNENLYVFMEENNVVYNQLDEVRKLLHKAWKIINDVNDELENTYNESLNEDVSDTFVWMCQHKYVALPRKEIEKITNKITAKFIDWQDVPTMAAACDHVDDLVESGTKEWAESKQEKLGKDCEILTVYDIAKNIQNLVSFNLDDDLEESVEYTDIIDAVKDTLKKRFPELIVSIVNKPKRAVRVECEKELEDGNTLFNEVMYIFEGSDGKLKAVREHDNPVIFVDIDGIVNFFEEYLNS